MAVYSSMLQLVAAVSSLTFVLVTGVEGLIGVATLPIGATAIMAAPVFWLRPRRAPQAAV
jgi:hypothetical protein